MNAPLVYAERLGWRVVPLHSAVEGACSCHRGSACESAGKHPRLSDWVSQASDDPAQIAEWWRQWPEANVGLLTGESFFVVDVDPYNGGRDTLAQLVADHGPLPVTSEARTGSGGSHYLFRMPEGRAVGCTKLGPGVDIKGVGGQIVAPPSVSAKGPYTWIHAPWTVPPVDAPAWLLARLGKPPERASTDTRGYFPPATPDVLAAAQEALRTHGPAVNGESGGLHTVHAAAILTHDFALTDDEAWPLFVEYNTTCAPPWEPDDLRERLHRGRKYGKNAYGCKRALDPLTTARKLLVDWQTAGMNEAGLFVMLEQIKPLVTMLDAPRRAIFAAELKIATGLHLKDLALPRPAPPPVLLRRGEIRVSVDLDRVTDESLQAILPHVFARNGVLCEVVRAERTFIHDLEEPRILYLMSRSATYVRQDERQGLVTQTPPATVAAMLRAQRMHPGARVLEAVTTAPVFLADGTILQERGYNSQARVFLEPNVAVDVPEAPTLADARAAMTMLKDLVCDFRFISRADFSSWAAALFSPLVKAATGNAPAPLVCMSASAKGAGKTTLADLIGWIITGRRAQRRPYNPRDVAEWQKRITSWVKDAAPVNLFDNVNGLFGNDESLDQLITSDAWSDRLLGSNDATALPIVGTWLASGRNIEPHGDTVRRVLMVRIDVLEERPQERTGFKYPNIEAHAARNRGRYLAAALTVLRAFHCAGRPDMGLPVWGSFVPWSELVRNALVWVGCADPYETQRRTIDAADDVEHAVHEWWLAIVAESDGTPGNIVLLANQRDAVRVLGVREQLAAIHLGKFLGRFVDLPRLGKRIRRVRDGGRTTYRVEQISDSG